MVVEWISLEVKLALYLMDPTYTCICKAYARCMSGPCGYVTGTEQTNLTFCMVYTTYIADISIYMVCTRYIPVTSVYTWYMPGIYWVYTSNNNIHLVYVSYLYGVYHVYYHYIFLTGWLVLCVVLWCCAGGQGPIPPDPSATTSPGLVMTQIFSLPALRHREFLLLVM